MTNEIVKIDPHALASGQSLEIETSDGRLVKLDVASVRQLLPGAKSCSNTEVAGFILWCQANRLDPLRRQAHLVKYSPNEPAAYVESYWVFVDRAQRNPAFDGMTAGIVWELPDKTRVRGKAADYTAGQGAQVAGSWCHVERKDRKLPFEVEVPWGEMVQARRDGVPNRNWAAKPTTMAVKVAISRGLRLAFAEELGSAYTDAEIEVDPGPTNAERTKVVMETLAVEGEVPTQPAPATETAKAGDEADGAAETARAEGEPASLPAQAPSPGQTEPEDESPWNQPDEPEGEQP